MVWLLACRSGQLALGGQGPRTIMAARPDCVSTIAFFIPKSAATTAVEALAVAVSRGSVHFDQAGSHDAFGSFSTDLDRSNTVGAPGANGYEVTTSVGKTGVVGLLRNGDGPTVMLRADMDALPVEEATWVPYASKVRAKDGEGKDVPVIHACGHDMHVTWLMGATALLAQSRKSWRGTLLAVFQPAEETALGAQAMIHDGLFKKFPKPDVVLGQHAMVGPAGTVASRAGPITSAADSLQIRLFGRGPHWRRHVA